MFLLAVEFAARLLRMAVSVMDSTNPRPNVGVGMRKIILRVLLKSGWRMEQPAGLSLRPTMVKMPCTPPSADPSGLRTNRTSRIGPSGVMKLGMWLAGAMNEARANCGLVLGGLDPPTAGNTWHPPHESRLNLGPRPPGTSSTSLNVPSASLKNAAWAGDMPVANAVPAPGAPPRTPGSLTRLVVEVTGAVLTCASAKEVIRNVERAASPRNIRHLRSSCRLAPARCPADILFLQL